MSTVGRDVETAELAAVDTLYMMAGQQDSNTLRSDLEFSVCTEKLPVHIGCLHWMFGPVD